MRKRLFLLTLPLLVSCTSVEQLAIDYMQPAEVSFPPTLRRVAVVNNVPNVPTDTALVAKNTTYYFGDSPLTTETLAEELAAGNYFDQVIICDSALRSRDTELRTTPLSLDEVNLLTKHLGADLLISLEGIQISAERKSQFIPEWQVYQGVVDAKVHTTVRIYLPDRRAPMANVVATDSIFWEKFHEKQDILRSILIRDKDIVREASAFAGSIPVHHLLPSWKSETRYYFTGGSVNMRDAAVYVREQNWPEACRLWQQTYDTKKGKQKMMAALNLALGNEMQDNIPAAIEWARKAQALATTERSTHEELTRNSYYVLITHYIAQLGHREAGLARLEMQMSRFNADF